MPAMAAIKPGRPTGKYGLPAGTVDASGVLGSNSDAGELLPFAGLRRGPCTPVIVAGVPPICGDGAACVGFWGSTPARPAIQSARPRLEFRLLGRANRAGGALVSNTDPGGLPRIPLTRRIGIFLDIADCPPTNGGAG